MRAKPVSKFSGMRYRPRNLILSVALPVLLLLAFLGNQLIRLDVIDWNHGFNHPLAGWDHLVTMLAVGIWAAQMRGKAIWLLPLAFVSVMSLGGLAGAAGLAIPSVEGIILLSCAVFSVLITRKVRFSTKVNVLIVAFFAFFHGFAHGQEISTSASLISYTLGFMFATLLLHGAGILVAKLVIVSVACLFTLLFANVSQANWLDAGVQDKVNTLSLADVHKHNVPLVSHSAGQNYLADESLAGVSESLLKQQKQVADSKLLVLSAPPEHGSAGFKLVNPWHGLSQQLALVCQQQQAVLIQTLFNVLHTQLILTAFNQYYPAINNSPGTCLLSNGVGLTSPPALIYPTAYPSAIPVRFSSVISRVETTALSLGFTQIPLDPSDAQSLNHSRHICALQKQLAMAACRNNFTNAFMHRSDVPLVAVNINTELQLFNLNPIALSLASYADIYAHSERVLRYVLKHNNYNNTLPSL